MKKCLKILQSLSPTQKYAVLFLIIILFLLTGLFFANIKIREHLSTTTCSTLEEIMMQQAHNFSSKLEAEKQLLQTLADSIVPNSADVFDISRKQINIWSTNFDNLFVADKAGTVVDNSGAVFQIKNKTFFLDSLKGATCISNLLLSQNGTKMIAISAPIYYKNEIIGVLIASYNAESLNHLFLSSFSGDGYTFVTDDDGTIVTMAKSGHTITQNDNLFADWQKAVFYDNDTMDVMYEKLCKNGAGHSKYNIQGKKRLMHYTGIGINDWNLFSVVPEEIIRKNSKKITNIFNLLSLTFIVIFSLLLYMLYATQKKHIQKLSHIAFVDELTGAPTLAKFKIEAQRLLEENPETSYILLKKDIDGFKLINQIFGYETGNCVLKNMVIALQSAMCSSKETFARVNIDEFIFLHEYLGEEHWARQRQVFNQTFFSLMGENFEYNIGFPAGHYYIKQNDGVDISEAIERANMAHKRAKQTGADVCVYDESMIRQAITVKDIENKMDAALKKGEFKMFLQPKYFLNSEKLAGAEALARWYANGKTVMNPSDFIPVCEKNGFVIKLDLLMFEEACKFLKNLIDCGEKPIIISVNFSRQHIYDESFISCLCEITQKYAISHDFLEIEITETALVEQEDALQNILEKLHAKGFTVSMDDFGTGYSSLGLLKNLAFDTIKIDRSFFVNAANSERTKKLLGNVIKMAKDLGIQTVAEGVEIKEHIDLLSSLGCDMVQGFYYSKPLPADDFTDFLP